MTEKANDMETDLRACVVALENWRVQRDIESARNDEKWAAMEHRIDTRFTGLERSVLDIQTSLSRINWLIIAGIVSDVMAFLIRGGLSPL